MKTADCRPGVKCRLRANLKRKKTRGSSLGQMKTWVRTRTRNFFPKFSNSHQNTFPSHSQTLHYQPRVLELPILFPQGPERIVTFVSVSAILNCVYAIRSGTEQLSICFILFSSTNSAYNVQSAACLSCFKGVCSCSEHKASKTRQQNNRAS